ncbi:MAG: sensor histidine kinase [Butyrivibrio sp.]|uniref:sensor histidine kinase n=1 Tax=Butyrivibrio sp. TaxID=28121 RepID=UPI001B15B170|nr:sensor histidine kinase [Butyrivibrio sp.]MBO6239723.1 sensor histidine kinase [Butyrivibrio sp.]
MGKMISWGFKKLGFFRLPIQRQIFLALVWLSIFTSIILGIVVYSVSRKTIEDQYNRAHESSIGVASEIVKLNLRSDVEQARSLLSSTIFLHNFVSENRSSTFFSASSNILIQDQLLKIISSNTEIRDILVVNCAGNIAFATQNDSNQKEIIHYYRDNDILNSFWIEEAEENKGKEVFYSRNVIFDDKNETFSLVKEIIEPVDYKKIGFLVMNIRKSDAFSKAFGTKDEGYGTDYDLIMTRDSDDNQYRLVYSSADLTEMQFREISRAFYNQDNSKNELLFTSAHNNLSGWDVVNVISKKELAAQSNYIALVSLIIGIVLVGISLPLSYTISGYITKPLYILEENIMGLGEGKYHVDAEFDDSEAGRIGQKFKDVVNNNLELENKLIQTNLKEREAELLLMQSQINPHYLYNTLDTLYMMAIIKNEDEIAEFVQALSENFRLSLNKGNKLIMVQDEIRRIQAYMKIQNYRFKDRYTLKINVSADLLRERMLTFILQPLVENAVFHGLEPRSEKGKVVIEGRLTDRNIEFVVEDDGVGIEDMSALENGYGVRNIKERIKLFYGEGYEPVFENTGSGTKVTIVVPRITTEQMILSM